MFGCEICRSKLGKMEPAQTSDQGRIGLEGRGGTKVPGNMLSRSTFRYVFVGGMAALGNAHDMYFTSFSEIYRDV